LPDAIAGHQYQCQQRDRQGQRHVSHDRQTIPRALVQSKAAAFGAAAFLPNFLLKGALHAYDLFCDVTARLNWRIAAASQADNYGPGRAPRKSGSADFRVGNS
jgi:hypothetical protein